MNQRQSLALAIKGVRQLRNLTQEDFSVVSSRTYLSTLERGLKSPTFDKLSEISHVLSVSPATLAIISYALSVDTDNAGSVIDQVCVEAKLLLKQLQQMIHSDFQSSHPASIHQQ
jgi:transcriptional regulator with XRE-family HTH domain